VKRVLRRPPRADRDSGFAIKVLFYERELFIHVIPSHSTVADSKYYF
jgi:hypothetical protein